MSRHIRFRGRPSLAVRRNWVSKRNCSAFDGVRSRSASRSRAERRVDGSRWTNVADHSHHGAKSRAWRLRAVKSAKSSSQVVTVTLLERSTARRARAPLSARGGRWHGRGALACCQGMTRPKSTVSSSNGGAAVSMMSRVHVRRRARPDRDEQRVAGEGRRRLIRGVAVSGGPDRKHLPPRLAHPLQGFDEPGSGGPERTDAEPTRK
jgi:hypothetical protein